MKNVRKMVLAAALMTCTLASTARADSFFWAVNQFTTIQKLNGDNGSVVEEFPVPFAPYLAASIAVVGDVGYYTILGDANVYKVDMATHLYLGVAFSTGNPSYMNGITNDANGNLWFAHGAGEALQEFNTTGSLLHTYTFPDAADSYRDGSLVFGGYVVANRGDQEGPYDKYAIPGADGALTYISQPFITAFGGNNGIAFNGVNYYVSNEQTHIVSKYDINGSFVSQANLPAASRYENWTFASQDIVDSTVPEPGSLLLLGTGLGGLGGFVMRRRRRTSHT
jgi:hypothetical protein